MWGSKKVTFMRSDVDDGLSGLAMKNGEGEDSDPTAMKMTMTMQMRKRARKRAKAAAQQQQQQTVLVQHLYAAPELRPWPRLEELRP